MSKDCKEECTFFIRGQSPLERIEHHRPIVRGPKGILKELILNKNITMNTTTKLSSQNNAHIR